MTRPPRISPSLLRDQADPARVDRVWRRLERRLSLADPASDAGRSSQRSRAAHVGLAAAAVAASFAGGVLVGRALEPSRPLPQTAGTIQGDDYESGTPAILVAGTLPVHYSLPGGSGVVVSPASIAEPVTHGTGGLTWRLLRGELEMSTGVGGGGRLSVLVGGASVSTDGGTIRVRADGDMAEVEVLEGMAEVAAPDAELGLRLDVLRAKERRRVPVRVRTASIEREPLSPPLSPSIHVAVREPAEDEAAPPPPPPAAPDWRQRCQAGEYDLVAKDLMEQYGSVGAAVQAAASAADLTCYGWALRGSDAAAAELALQRLVREFPNDPNASLAAYSLATMYSRAGNAERAAFYFQENRRLSPGGGLAEDALCNRIEAEERAGNKEEATRLAREYLADHPEGECRGKVEQLLQRLGNEVAADAGDATTMYDDGPDPSASASASASTVSAPSTSAPVDGGAAPSTSAASSAPAP